MSFSDNIKNDLHTLAEAQLAFELNNWERVESIQRDPFSESQAWGTLYKKDDKSFYLNINSASKAILLLRRAV
jgi:hypothetical protein